MRTKQHDIPATVRTAVGKSAARRLRVQSKIPAVVYGRDMKAIPIADSDPGPYGGRIRFQKE